jgi:hypothetical protein
MTTMPKLPVYRLIALSLLILANLLVGSYVLYSRQVANASAKIVPPAELSENAVIQNRVSAWMAQNQTRQIAIAMFTSASTSCTTGKIAEIFKDAARVSDSKKFVVILPNEFSPQDVENFKTNLDLDIKVEKADDELASQWIPVATKYEALGVVLISNRGELLVSQDPGVIKANLELFK